MDADCAIVEDFNVLDEYVTLVFLEISIASCDAPSKRLTNVVPSIAV
jgi:hypothetical protein